MGEYAVTSGCGNGNLIAAVAEAAFMTGMERNGDVVAMSSYAPLFVQPVWKTWNPNAIVFDSSRVYGTPSYYVQAMFAANRADRAVEVDVDGRENNARPGRIGVATWRTHAEFKDIRVTHNGKTMFASDFSQGMDGWRTAGGEWEVRDGALSPDQQRRGRPRAGRRSEVDRLHAHAQGPQNIRRRGFPHPLQQPEPK